MLYFDDFMEAIENLPAELSESLTTVRQLDLMTQNTLEPLHEVTRVFFEDCKYDRLSEFEKSMQHSEMVKEYDKALSYCKEKREIVEKIYNTYKILVRKLDAELEKFRLELEADNSGITEQIEQRTHAILGHNSIPVSKVEKRRQRFRLQQPNHFKHPFLVRRRIVGQACRTVLKNTSARPSHPHKSTDQHSRFAIVHSRKSSRPTHSAFHGGTSKANNFSPDAGDAEKFIDDNGPLRRSRANEFQETDVFFPEGTFDAKSIGHSFTFSAPRSDYSNTPTTKSDLEGDAEDLSEYTNNLSTVTTKHSPFFTLGAQTDVGTPSLDRSGRSVSRHNVAFDFAYQQADASDRSINSSTTSTATHSNNTFDGRYSNEQCPVNWSAVSGPRERRARTSRRPNRDSILDELIPDALRTTDSITFEETASSGPGSTSDGMFDPSTVGFVQDMKLDHPDEGLEEDEDEKRYCWCHNVSYGDMIACDAPNCPYEWFHYGCVNLTVAPKGSWYCPSCIKSQSNVKGSKKRVSRK